MKNEDFFHQFCIDRHAVYTVAYWWAAKDPDNPGWYAVGKNAIGEVVDDSEKIWFRVDVRSFDQHGVSELYDALSDAYPDADVIYLGD